MQIDIEERLPQQIARQNIFIAGAYLLISLGWSSLSVTLSVLAGCLIAISSFSWLYATLQAILPQGNERSIRKFRWHYGIRIIVTGLILFLLFFYVKINPIALFLGLSVVFISILIGIIRFSIQAGR